MATLNTAITPYCTWKQIRKVRSCHVVPNWPYSEKKWCHFFCVCALAFLRTLNRKKNPPIMKMWKWFQGTLPSRFWTRCVLGARGSAKLNWVYLLCWICRKASKFPSKISHSHWAFTHGIRHSFAFSYFSPLGLEITHTPWLASQVQDRSLIPP